MAGRLETGPHRLWLRVELHAGVTVHVQIAVEGTPPACPHSPASLLLRLCWTVLAMLQEVGVELRQQHGDHIWGKMSSVPKLRRAGYTAPGSPVKEKKGSGTGIGTCSTTYRAGVELMHSIRWQNRCAEDAAGRNTSRVRSENDVHGTASMSRFTHVDADHADLDVGLELARRDAGTREQRGAVAVLVAVHQRDGLVQRVHLRGSRSDVTLPRCT